MTDHTHQPVVPVVIVGAGPTGLTAAALLARHAVACTVIERDAVPYPLPRAVHMDDEVLRILQMAGVGDEALAISRRGIGMRLVDSKLRELLEIRRDAAIGAHGWPQTNMFDQPHLENILREHLRATPQVTMRTGCEVIAIDIRADGLVDLTVRDSDGESTLTARFVLGCDGAHSTIRAHITGTDSAASDYADVTDLKFTQRWLVIDGECSSNLGMWAGVHQVCGGANAATFMQISDTRYRWEFRLPDDHDPLTTFTDRDVADFLAPWSPPDGVLEIVRHTTYSHRAHVARTWRSGPLFVLGDAAHLTPPFIGQGLGAGQRDAANLTWKLAAVLRSGAPDELLDTYGPERRRHVLRAVAAATLIGRIMAVPVGLRRATLHAALRTASRLPSPDPLVQQLLEPRVRGSTLTRARRLASSAIGLPVPQEVSADGHRSDDRLGPGFSYLHLSESSGALTDLATAQGAQTVLVTDSAQPTIYAWMHRHKVREVFVRPDRVVAACVDRRGRVRESASLRSLLRA